MNNEEPLTEYTNRKLYRTALWLSIFTIVYNVIEGLVSVYFGMEDDTLALLGFGIDSFVEVISGLGIAHMVLRMRGSDVLRRDDFERRALWITGIAFYVLVGGLLAGSAVKLWQQTVPETTMVGIVVAVISLLTMYFLMTAKLRVGRALDSDAIIADANCTKTCFYLSAVLLVSSGLFEIFQIAWLDILGSLGIAWFAFREGREAIEKARGGSLSCSCEDECH